MGSANCGSRECAFGFKHANGGMISAIGFNGVPHFAAVCSGCAEIAKAEGNFVKFFPNQITEFERIEAEFEARGNTLAEKFENHILEKIAGMRARGVAEETIGEIVIDAEVNYREIMRRA